MARNGPPEDPGYYPDDEPTTYLGYGDQPPGEPVPWYRKPAALVAFGALGAVIIALLIYAIVKLVAGGTSSEPTSTTTTTPTTTTTAVLVPAPGTVTETATATTAVTPSTTTTAPTTTTTTEPSTSTSTSTTVSTSTSTSTVTETQTVTESPQTSAPPGG